MMTSRSEYRLLLRQDNADERLMPLGFEIGLVSKEDYDAFLDRTAKKEQEIERLETTHTAPLEELNNLLEIKGTAPLKNGSSFADLIRRPQICYDDLKTFDKERPTLPQNITEKVETEIKYKGYIERQFSQVKEMQRLENRLLPENINYDEIKGLRLEAVEKLKKVAPANIGQASRISGVSPADISVLIIYLSK